MTAIHEAIQAPTIERAPETAQYSRVDEIVTRLRAFAEAWPVDRVNAGSRKSIDVLREDGTYDGLMLSARALAAATAKRRDGIVSVHPPSEIAGVAAAGYDPFSRARKKDCDSRVLRNVRLAIYFDDAYSSGLIGSAASNPVVAERLMQSYEDDSQGGSSQVLGAVAALHSMRVAEKYTLEDGVHLGGETFGVVMAAKTHRDLHYGAGPAYAPGDTDDALAFKQKSHSAHLKTMEALLSESQRFESRTALWMVQYIFSSKQEGLWYHARHAKIEPSDDLLGLEETRERIAKAY